MTAVSIRGLSKRFSAQAGMAPALRDLSLEIPDGTFFTLLGPSGCGKSTLLRCIAGLETADEGDIEFGGAPVFSARQGIDVPPNKRRIGMVFQSYAIWPHMTVIQNVAFPLEIMRHPRPRQRAMEALSSVGLADFADRLASNLSGGQQQRVALARAIVPEPTLLLLDEPLSNLDAALREQMREELQKLQQDLHITTIYVTHDQMEALSLSDTIAVMRGGELVEAGTPQDLYARPRSAFSARFVGGANVLSGTATSSKEGTLLQTSFGQLKASEPAAEGERVFFVRPERIRISATPPSRAVNTWTSRVISRRFVGDATEFDLDLGQPDLVLHARTNDPRATQLEGEISVSIDPSDIHFLSRN